jgi:hypothetical protein
MRPSLVRQHWDAILVGLVFVTNSAWVGCASVPHSFSPEQPIAAQDFSDREFAQVLAAHVKDGWVDYGAIAHDQRFSDYLRQLDRVNPNRLPTPEERLAFWINAYNAFAIKGILDGYSPLTLFGRYRYFIGQAYRVGGVTINLYDLEHKLLIPEFREPRLHFAIVCASISCPKLQSHVYTGSQLEAQLEESAKAFMNDPTKNRFDRERKIASLSMIFKWFEEDFVAHSGSLMNYVKQYLVEPGLARELDTTPYAVQFIEYDWRLNGTQPDRAHAANLP